MIRALISNSLLLALLFAIGGCDGSSGDNASDSDTGVEDQLLAAEEALDTARDAGVEDLMSDDFDFQLQKIESARGLIDDGGESDLRNARGKLRSAIKILDSLVIDVEGMPVNRAKCSRQHRRLSSIGWSQSIIDRYLNRVPAQSSKQGSFQRGSP